MQNLTLRINFRGIRTRFRGMIPRAESLNLIPRIRFSVKSERFLNRPALLYILWGVYFHSFSMLSTTLAGRADRAYILLRPCLPLFGFAHAPPEVWESRPIIKIACLDLNSNNWQIKNLIQIGQLVSENCLNAHKHRSSHTQSKPNFCKSEVLRRRYT